MWGQLGFFFFSLKQLQVHFQFHAKGAISFLDIYLFFIIQRKTALYRLLPVNIISPMSSC